MRARVFLTALAAGLALVPAAAAARTPAPLAQAEAKTAQAESLRIAMTMSLSAAGRSFDFTATGVERPQAHQASLSVDLSKLDPSVGRMEVLSIGKRFYLHYDFLDTLRATHPQVRPWIVTASAAAAGYDPWSLSKSLGGTLQGATNLHAAGTATVDGTQVTRYVGTFDLRGALALSPQLGQLLKGAGSAAAGLLGSKIPIELDVGADGYLHRVVERFALPIPGAGRMTMAMAMTLSGFGEDVGTLVAPPASQTMSLAAFKKLAGG